jgi:thiol-disulfide isomerase/thioredoxin
MIRTTFRRRLLPVLFLLLAPLLAVPAHAQFTPQGAVAPGDRVTPEMVASTGTAGRELARLVGNRPVLLTWWRPGDPAAENALYQAVETAKLVAPEIAVLPVAFLAARQDPRSVDAALARMNLTGVRSFEGSGGLARRLGVRGLPSFALIDAGGVLRLVGGSSIEQTGTGETTIAEAIALAGRGAAVPTLGVIPTDPIYRMLGQPLPEASVLDPASGERRSLRSLLEPGHRMLIFYWRPGCGHCKTELPRLEAWYREQNPEDLVVVDLAQSGSDAAVRSEYPGVARVPWTHLLDDRSELARGMGIRETPTMVLVGSDGEVLSLRSGAGVDWESWLGG